MEKMFCFQCEQTANGVGCTIDGVCGKCEETANLQDYLLSRTIEFANCADITEQNTQMIIDALFTTVTNVNFDNSSIHNLIEKIENKIPCSEDYSIKTLWESDDDIKSLKSLVLFGLKGAAAYTYHARILGYKEEEIDKFFYKALRCISEDLTIEELLTLVLEVGKINLKCMELLDKANTETYGNPTPTKVSTEIEAGAFIVVSGHDLKDLELLLEQTKDKNINIYTHGEMLPCHAYPKLRKYPHLKGNFGTAWQNQQKEFENIPAAILFTTNCIMPVKESYKDRVFTTSLVEYPKIEHIDSNKDFTPVITKALELGGYKEKQLFTGINGGNILTTGFGHNYLFSIKDKIVNSIKSVDIKHIFLVGGCDGAKVGRNYYTDFVQKAPNNTLILTLACGKYRFNDLDLGEINGIPRLIDIGQCNDAYSAIKFAIELSKELKCNVNELPMSFVLSWYEQKAVAILLTLLYLDVKNIKLGPTLPAFISTNVLNLLEEKFCLKQTTTPKDDLNDIIG